MVQNCDPPKSFRKSKRATQSSPLTIFKPLKSSVQEGGTLKDSDGTENNVTLKVQEGGTENNVTVQEGGTENNVTLKDSDDWVNHHMQG